MKSFLNFLKENSTIVDEGIFIGEDVPMGKFTSTKEKDTLIGSDTKQGFYLYFVEYDSLNKPGQSNIYFGIKYRPGSEGDPDLFWGSLRTQNEKLNKPLKMSMWKDFVVKCSSNVCKPESENIVKPGNIYMSSASAQTPESLPRTIYQGLTNPDKQEFHPWIVNTTTLKYAKKAAGVKDDSDIKIYPISKNRNTRIPTGNEYAYRVYVLDDMNKLQEVLTKIRKSSSKLPAEVKTFFKQAEDNKKYIKEVLITENAQEFIAKFYPIIEEYYKDKKKPSELSTKESYFNFLKKSIEKNAWVLVGTFESLATIMMDNLINEKKEGPYDHLNKLYNKKTDTGVAFQVKSTQKIINFKPELFDVYLPASLNKEAKDELGAYLTGDDASAIKEREKKKKEDEERKIENQKKREVRSKLMFVPIRSDFIVDDVATNFLKDIVNAVNNKDVSVVVKLRKYFLTDGIKDMMSLHADKPLNKLFIKSSTRNEVYLKSPTPVSAGDEKKFSNKITKLTAYDYMKQVLSMTTSDADILRRMFTMYDFVNTFFDIDLPAEVKFMKVSDFVKSDYMNKLTGNKKKEETKEKEQIAASYIEDINGELLNEAEVSKVDKAAFTHVFDLLKTEKNPYRNIFFQFNDKVSQLNKGSLKEDTKGDDKSFDKLKKLVILSSDFGITHHNLSKK